MSSRHSVYAVELADKGFYKTGIVLDLPNVAKQTMIHLALMTYKCHAIQRYEHGHLLRIRI